MKTKKPQQFAPHVRHIRGFTLLELLVVMVIIGLLAGFVAPRYFAQVGKSQVKAARAQIDALDKALEQYRIDVGHLPTTEQGLPRSTSPRQASRTGQGRTSRKRCRLIRGAMPITTPRPARITTTSIYLPSARMAARVAPEKTPTSGIGSHAFSHQSHELGAGRALIHARRRR